MFIVKGHRGSSVFQQLFNNFKEANEKSKWLAANGFAAEITHAHARS